MGNKTTVWKERRGLPGESGAYRYGYDELQRLNDVEKDGKLLRRYRMDKREHDARGKGDSRRRSEDNGGGRGLCLARERLKRNASPAGSGTDQRSRCLYEELVELDP